MKKVDARLTACLFEETKKNSTSSALLSLSFPIEIPTKTNQAAGFDAHLKVLEKEIASIKAATEGE